MKLNGYGLYNSKRNTVKAFFHGELDIVFEGLNHSECMKWCHENGMKMMDETKYREIINASFRKTNAKNQFNANDYTVATVA